VTYNVPYTDEPVCAQPSRLTGKKFGELDVDEFACPPEIISAPRYVEAKSGKWMENRRSNTIVYFKLLLCPEIWILFA
jgi:hypothetical protein